MESILYENFLQNELVYHELLSFWEKEVQVILDPLGFKQHFIWNVSDDGNPIFATKVIRGKVIRIIQHEVDTLPGRIAAWTKTTEDRQDWPIEELVIVLQLTSKTQKLALDLIQKWVDTQTTTTTSINLYIENNL